MKKRRVAYVTTPSPYFAPPRFSLRRLRRGVHYDITYHPKKLP